MGSQIQIPIRLSLKSWKNAFDASQEAVRGNRKKNPPLSLVEDKGQSSMSFFRDAGRVLRCASISFAEIGYIQRERDSCSSVVIQLCNPNSLYEWKRGGRKVGAVYYRKHLWCGRSYNTGARGSSGSDLFFFHREW